MLMHKSKHLKINTIFNNVKNTLCKKQKYIAGVYKIKCVNNILQIFTTVSHQHQSNVIK